MSSSGKDQESTAVEVLLNHHSSPGIRLRNIKTLSPSAYFLSPWDLSYSLCSRHHSIMVELAHIVCDLLFTFHSGFRKIPKQGFKILFPCICFQVSSYIQLTFIVWIVRGNLQTGPCTWSWDMEVQVFMLQVLTHGKIRADLEMA